MSVAFSSLFKEIIDGRCHFTGQAVVKSLQGLNQLEREDADKVSGVVYPIDPDHAHFDASIYREVSASTTSVWAGERLQEAKGNRVRLRVHVQRGYRHWGSSTFMLATPAPHRTVLLRLRFVPEIAPGAES